MHHDASHVHKCPTCSVQRLSKDLLTRHQREKRHCYCGDCNRAFGSASAVQSHLQSSRHSSEFRCCDCDRGFVSSHALGQHLRQKVHREPNATSRKVSSSQNQQRHASVSAKSSRLGSASFAHQPFNKLACIAVTRCKKNFSSPSALLHHLESGACPSGMNHEKIEHMVLNFDTERLFSKHSQGGVAGMLVEVNERLQINNPSGRLTSPKKFAALEQSHVSGVISPDSDGCWTPVDGNMEDWAALVSRSTQNHCPFCPSERRRFAAQKDLENHLRSPVHNLPFLFCPANLATGVAGESKPRRAFTTVSGLVQHLESGACIGGADTFWRAVTYLDKRFKLLGLNMALTNVHNS
jgi:hypothetical protein